jgi:hypothetical protein
MYKAKAVAEIFHVQTSIAKQRFDAGTAGLAIY